MRIALGTAQFGMNYGVSNSVGQVPSSEIGAMLQLALAKNLNTLDTAVVYGESEACLGQVGVQAFNVITKLPPMLDVCNDVGSWVNAQVNASLSRLGLTKIYGLLLHRPDQLLNTNGRALYHALRSVQSKNQVEKIGVSIYSPAELATLLSVGFEFDIVQAPFNLVDRRLKDTGWLSRLKDAGVEVHTRSAFLQGLLLMTQANRPAKFSHWNGLWRIWEEWLEVHSVSALHVCLGYPLSFPEIDRVIVGADDFFQLSQIVDAVGNHLIGDLPDLKCDDENLINPSNWSKL